MKQKLGQPDKFFLIVTVILALAGLLMFVSASMKLLTVQATYKDFYGSLVTQVILGLIGGGFAAFAAYRLPYKIWEKYAAVFFGITTMLLLTVLFVGDNINGARRWLDIGFMSFQPAELHKISLIMLLSSWYSFAHDKVKTVMYGLVPFLVILGVTAAILIVQRDMGSIMVMTFSSLAVYFVAGANKRHLLWVGLAGFVMSIIMYISVGYIHNRIDAYFFPPYNPSEERGVSWVSDAHNKLDVMIGRSYRSDGYQSSQASLALGSGELWGLGYLNGQQKLTNLPKPENDAIYAVVGEEFGFVGSMVVLLLYMLFLIRGIKISNQQKDRFPRLLALGLVILIVSQSFINIGAILEVLPLTGIPLIFFSQGGTALFFALVTVGIVLKISRYQKNKKIVIK